MNKFLRFPVNAGIAIGPVLFVIAALGLIAALISSNIGTYSSASVIDRIGADLPSQASLIRTKIQNCNLTLASSLAIANNNACDATPGVCGTLCRTTADCQKLSTSFPSTTNSPPLVNTLKCNGSDMWAGVSYPQATTGFSTWNYVANTAGGGYCIWTQPTMSNPVNNQPTIEGLRLAAKKFSNVATCNGTTTPCTSEVLYNAASTSQKFILWIAPPTSGTAPDPACLP
jgi:hypothetical protein